MTTLTENLYNGSRLTAHGLYCLINESSQIKNILIQFIKYFPDLEQRVKDIDSYSEKLSCNARVLCQYLNDDCTGFAAYYANNIDTKTGYITLIAIHENFRRQGLGSKLIRECFDDMLNSGMNRVRLEVRKENTAAIEFYKSEGFAFESEASPESFYMMRELYDNKNSPPLYKREECISSS